MNRRWKEISLGEVIKLEYGKSLSSDKRTLSGKYPVYGANGEKNRTNEFYYDRESIIVGRKGSAGEINLTEKRFWPLDVTYFVTFNDKQYSLGFLYNLLLTLNLSKLAKGVKPGINRNEIYKIRVNIPSLLEQQRIVKVLDEVFKKIAKAKENAEKNLQNARELFESYLQSVFTNPIEEWEEKKLLEIGNIQTGTTPKTSDKKNYGDFIPFIKPADIDIFGDGGIRYDNERLSKFGLQNGRLLPKCSVLMVCIGASIGKVGYTNRDVSCNQQINSLAVNKGYYPRFFYYALRTQRFYNQVIKNSAQATLPIINKSKWGNLSVLFPKSSSYQQAIVAKLDSLSTETKKLETIYQQKLNDLEKLKKSILQKAFNGELVEVLI